MSVNRAILSGNVGNDADIRSMSNGDLVASFSLATTEYWTDKATGDKKKTTEWHKIVVYNQAQVKTAEQYVKKGSKLIVEGAIKSREYQDKDGITRKITEIVVSRFDGKIHLEGRPNTVTRDEHGYGTQSTRSYGGTRTESSGFRPTTPGAPIDDDIPF